MAQCFTKPETIATKAARGMKLLSYGDRILAGEYFRHSRFRQAINFACDDQLLSVVTPEVGAGPLNFVLSDIVNVEADYTVVGSDSVQIGETIFALNADRRYNSTITIPADFQSVLFHSRFALFKQELRKYSPPDSLVFLLNKPAQQSFASTFDAALEVRFRDGCRLLKEGRWTEGVQLVKGLGRGLTPSGDDFIAGLLIALNLHCMLFRQDTSDLIERIFRVAVSNNPFSTAFLRCAKDGCVFVRLKQTLDSVFSPSADTLAADVLQLVRVGGTTGCDLAVGLIVGLETSPPTL